MTSAFGGYGTVTSRTLLPGHPDYVDPNNLRRGYVDPMDPTLTFTGGGSSRRAAAQAAAGTRAMTPGSTATITSTPTQFQPGQAESIYGQMGDVARGFMDPSSAYFQQLMAKLRKQIGQSAEAESRAAALRAAQGGIGMGASPELLAAQGGISEAGLEAAGGAAADLALAAPEMGLRFGTAAGGGMVDIAGRRAGLAEGARQFDVSAGQRGAELASQRELAAAEQARQDRQLQMQFVMQMMSTALRG